VPVNTVDEDDKLSPEGSDHAYCVASDTPVTDGTPEPDDAQNVSAGIVPPDGDATIETVPVTGVPEQVTPDAIS
jgi:hypothetical protein